MQSDLKPLQEMEIEVFSSSEGTFLLKFTDTKANNWTAVALTHDQAVLLADKIDKAICVNPPKGGE